MINYVWNGCNHVDEALGKVRDPHDRTRSTHNCRELKEFALGTPAGSTVSVTA